nr:exostosin-like 1 isoform X1 [Taeniopygia guttata]
MQTRKKYIFLTFLASWLLLFFFGGDQLRRFAFFSGRKAEARRSWPRWTDRSLLKSFAEPEELQRDGDPSLLSPRERRVAWLSGSRGSRCRMETCFDLSRCERHGFKVFTYPQERGQPVSETYSKILSSIERSRYHTLKPEEACLFILSIDTLDRDHLSGHYVRDVGEKIRGFPLWNGGRNHLIFNLYSGTWPGYTGDLGFDSGQAMLAKASFDTSSFRPGFDISIPLFPREHPQRGGDGGWLRHDSLPPKKKYLLVFKGKRYLTGIGSGTRNALHHIHNGKDIISLTTCKHGKDWEKHKDTRCDKDNVDYERFDYQELLHNSTFCIVPRGRRLGSFRFLEALQAACIPVLLSDGWELPFAEAIDWGKAAVVGSERLLLQIPSALRCIPPERVLAFQQQTQFLWDAYFSSVDKIVHTTLEIIKDRLSPHRSRSRFLWNALPGGLLVLPDFSTHLGDFPFYHLRLGRIPPAPAERGTLGLCPTPLLSLPHLFFRLQPLREVHGVHPGGVAGRVAVAAHPQAHPSCVWIPALRQDRGPVELREAATPELEMAPEQRAPERHPGQEGAQRPLLPLRGHPDGRGAEPGRGHQPLHQRGGFCLLGVAQLPRAHRGLPHAEPLLGPRAGALGLHLQMDQRALHGPHRRRLLPQVLPQPLHRVPARGAAGAGGWAGRLRGHPDERPGGRCHQAATHQGDPAQAAQGGGGPAGGVRRWGCGDPPTRAEEPPALLPAAGLPQPVGRLVWLHAPGVLPAAPRPCPLQGPGVRPAQEIPEPGEAVRAAGLGAGSRCAAPGARSPPGDGLAADGVLLVLGF